ncbi:MAG: SRPBCC family protein [Chloroflexota bacterium]|nr:SRPBCC family protein [Chloroflexota bacterium]
MSKLERTIAINAPVEKVFAYLTQPTNFPEIWPSMVEVKEVKNIGGVGGQFSWVYKMAGMRFEGKSEYAEFVPNQRVVAKSSGGLSSTFVWTYQRANGGTQLRVEVEYKVPLPLLGKLAEQFVVKQNEHEMDTLLANLKARMET